MTESQVQRVTLGGRREAQVLLVLFLVASVVDLAGKAIPQGVDGELGVGHLALHGYGDVVCLPNGAWIFVLGSVGALRLEVGDLELVCEVFGLFCSMLGFLRAGVA